MTKLDYTLSLICRLRDMKGQPPWNRMAICLALTKGPLTHDELKRLVNGGKYELGGPLTTVQQKGEVVNEGNLWRLTPAGEELVAEILTQPVPEWPVVTKLEAQEKRKTAARATKA